MSADAEALADHFAQVNDEFIGVIERCTPEQWRARDPGEQRPVNVVAYHVASAQAAQRGWVQAIAEGQPLRPMTREGIDELNARHAQRYANVTREEVIAKARSNGAQVVQFLRGLDDAQLDRTGQPFSRVVRARDVIERALIGHIVVHLRSIREAIGD